MKMYRIKWLLAFCAILSCLPLCAQQPDYSLKENSVWTFGGDPSTEAIEGDGLGLNFNTGPVPELIYSSAGGYGEAQASVSDANGHLLFYTEGSFIFDTTGNIMPHGDSLESDPALYIAENPLYGFLDPTSSTTQGTLIVPVLNNPNRYYVFSLTSEEFYIPIPNNFNVAVSKGHGGELFYSVVDMSLNNGLGDVITSQRGVFLDSNLSESMVAVAGTHCDIWILVHGLGTPIIYAFNVNANGINPVPVVSNCGAVNDVFAYEFGAMKVSPDRRKIAVCATYEDFDNKYCVGGAEICDFDPATGIASNPVVLTNAPSYEACFSPDNSKLYVNSINPYNLSENHGIMEYELNNLNINPVNIDSCYITDVQLGPDGKIYFLNFNEDSIQCIATPNLSSPACNFIPNLVGLIDPMGSNNKVFVGLHNLYVKPLLNGDTTFVSHTEVPLCAPLDSVALSAPAGFFNYQWSNGSTDSTIGATGPNVYTVTSENNCEVRSDTFSVHKVDIGFTLGPDTAYCSFDSVLLNVPIAGASYLWQDGNTNSSYKVNGPGTYSVQVNNMGCTYADTVTINSKNCNCIPFIPSAFTPNEDGLNDVFRAEFRSNCLIDNYILSVYNRWGQLVFTTTDVSQGWDGTFHGLAANVDVYMYTVQFVSSVNQQQIQYQKGDVTLVR